MRVEDVEVIASEWNCLACSAKRVSPCTMSDVRGKVTDVYHPQLTTIINDEGGDDEARLLEKRCFMSGHAVALGSKLRRHK